MNRNSVWVTNVVWIFRVGSVCIFGLFVTGCGDNPPEKLPTAGVEHGAVLRISIEGSKFSKSKLATKSVEFVTIFLSVPKTEKDKHALVIKGNGINTQSRTVRPGHAVPITIGAKPGSYTYSDAYSDAKGILIIE